MTTTFETAKVGDRVWSVEYGWGEVQFTDYSDTYPVRVNHHGGIAASYTLEGKRLVSQKYQTLFWDEVKIEAPQKPLPDLEVDAKVLVWTDPSKKYRRHFSHFGRDGHIYTFDAGATSFSKLHRKSITCWPNWEVAE